MRNFKIFQYVIFTFVNLWGIFMWLSFSHLSFAPAPFHIPLLSENWDRTPTDFPMFGALREHWYIFLPLTIACVIVYPYNIYKLIKNKP